MCFQIFAGGGQQSTALWGPGLLTVYLYLNRSVWGEGSRMRDTGTTSPGAQARPRSPFNRIKVCSLKENHPHHPAQTAINASNSSKSCLLPPEGQLSCPVPVFLMYPPSVYPPRSSCSATVCCSCRSCWFQATWRAPSPPLRGAMVCPAKSQGSWPLSTRSVGSEWPRC